jgi:hypothetical protein
LVAVVVRNPPAEAGSGTGGYFGGCAGLLGPANCTNLHLGGRPKTRRLRGILMRRFIYLDRDGLAGLSAQARATAKGSIRAIATRLMGSAFGSAQGRDVKSVRGDEAVIHVEASLESRGELAHVASADQLIALIRRSTPVFLTGRLPFVIPYASGMDVISNVVRNQFAEFELRQNSEGSSLGARVMMGASLRKFTDAVQTDRGMAVGMTGHTARAIRGAAAAATDIGVFGLLSKVGPDYYIKPFAISN